MRIEGKCHCGNITYVLHWPAEGTKIPVRACSCSFCTKHGGVYTSHGDAELAAVVHDEGLVSRYRFGTETAEFYLLFPLRRGALRDKHDCGQSLRGSER